MAVYTSGIRQAARKLVNAGFEVKQANEIVDLIFKSQEQEALVTRDYLDYKLEKELSFFRQDNAVIKATFAAIVVGVSILLVKAYS